MTSRPLSSPLRDMLRRVAPSLAFAALLGACSSPAPTPDVSQDTSRAGATAEPPGPDPVCPEQAPAPDRMPGVSPEHESADYWIEQLRHQGALDTPALDPAHLDAHSRAIVRADLGRHSLAEPFDPARLRQRIDERNAWMVERFADGAWFHADGTSASALTSVADAPVRFSDTPTLHAVLRTVQVACFPLRAPLFTASLDLRFNRNNCSSLHPQEPVRVLGRRDDGLVLVEGEYTWGWLDGTDALSAAIAPDVALAWLDSGAHRVVSVDVASDALPIAPDHFVRSTAEGAPAWVSAEGRVAPVPRGVRTEPVARPLTREALLRVAFSFAGAPYGWGGQDGGRDCSRFVQDAFEAFGLRLPRHSVSQSLAGTFHVDVPAELPETDRGRLLDVLNEHGLVLLHFPGHIMLYLGRDRDGVAMGLHAFAEYVEPCDEPGSAGNDETLRTVTAAGVSTLELGRGSSRGAFIERITRMTVIGAPPDARVEGIATLRDAAPTPAAGACDRSGAQTIFASPALPRTGETLRLIGAPLDDLRPVRIDVVDEAGRRHDVTSDRLGGPPFVLAGRFTPSEPGTYTARLGDGDDVLACVRFDVSASPRRAELGGAGDPVWPVTTTWGPQTEAFFAAFVEKLFDYPVDEDVSWSNLQSVLQNADNNLLFNHFGHDEESNLRLEPDCADLPYFLRAYFAWKMGLPFSYRRCSRGRAGRPPACGEPEDNLQVRTRADGVEAFGRFAQGPVRNTVHSSSGRTLPEDEASDFYPVEMSRDGLRPGTVYHDPYGHLMVVTRWVPQTHDGWGLLLAADAQPDKTVGRRRFWRGTFLFTPETTDVGAGFKAWRPVVADRASGTTRQLDNAAIRRGEHVSARGIPRFALDQYEGSLDDFYDRMDALINPRPLDPWSVQVSLIDALEESTVRRVQSVDTGEDWMRRNRFPTMEMPTGSSIFLTSGPWEDFSTPSRDMRLLVAIDAVRDFAGRVRRQPERFDVDPDRADASVDALIARRDAELAARAFVYTRSDGSPWTLTLADLLARATAMEVAYNPNDCPELRWAAPEQSDELATCRGRAPSAQRARMEEYRPWFRDRQRPAR